MIVYKNKYELPNSKVLSLNFRSYYIKQNIAFFAALFVRSRIVADAVCVDVIV